MKLQDLFESTSKNVLVIYGGRFQPIHKGHAAVFRYLQSRFGDQVFLATSNLVKLPNSPFTFEEKLELAKFIGIPEDRIVQTRSPYKPTEILDLVDPTTTKLIFAIGAKDSDRFAGAKSIRPFEKLSKCLTMDQTAYSIVVPTVEFELFGQTITSASQIREIYPNLDDFERRTFIVELYGSYSADIQQLLDAKLALSQLFINS